MSKIQSFLPVGDKNSKVLILGSMPGPESLRQQQYYAYPSNSFWRIIFGLWGLEAPTDYEQRLAFVLEKNIALWDSLSHCVRKGAGDSQIKKADLNDIPGFLTKHTKVKAVFCNGRASHSFFTRGFSKQLDIACYYLPSTSPAYAAMRFEAKFESWKALKKILEEN